MSENRKKHLRGFSSTMCGKKEDIFTVFAKTFKEVTCKTCMKSWEYKQYLLGKFKEKNGI